MKNRVIILFGLYGLCFQFFSYFKIYSLHFYLSTMPNSCHKFKLSISCQTFELSISCQTFKLSISCQTFKLSTSCQSSSYLFPAKFLVKVQAIHFLPNSICLPRGKTFRIQICSFFLSFHFFR